MVQNGRFLKSSEGNIAIEFAVVLPVLFLLLSGVINFGLILANQNQLNGVVSAGMLYAFGNSSDHLAVEQAMKNSTTNLSPLTVNATTFCSCLDSEGIPASCTATCAEGAPAKYVTVTAQSQVSLIALDFILANPFETKAQGTIRTLR